MALLSEITSENINLELIFEKYPDEIFNFSEGFDDAILGVDDDKMVIVYSTKKYMEILVKEADWEYEEALEYFEFNVKGSRGGKFPIFIDDVF